MEINITKGLEHASTEDVNAELELASVYDDRARRELIAQGNALAEQDWAHITDRAAGFDELLQRIAFAVNECLGLKDIEWPGSQGEWHRHAHGYNGARLRRYARASTLANRLANAVALAQRYNRRADA